MGIRLGGPCVELPAASCCCLKLVIDYCWARQLFGGSPIGICELFEPLVGGRPAVVAPVPVPIGIEDELYGTLAKFEFDTIVDCFLILSSLCY